jgi:hypothetical protein
VRVVSELAKRVHVARWEGRVEYLSAPTRIAGIETHGRSEIIGQLRGLLGESGATAIEGLIESGGAVVTSAVSIFVYFHPRGSRSINVMLTTVSLLAELVVVLFALFLVGLALVAFAKPAIAERFFSAFANSARTHYTEQAFRLLIGASLVVLSPAMWQANFFRIVGWIIVISSVGLLVIPWRWHHRFGQRVMPLVFRHLRLYAVGLTAFGVLLLVGVLREGP